MLSYQSLMPAGAGTPRCENWVHWLVEGFRCLRPPYPSPLAGDKPQRYISPSTLGCRCSGDGGWCRRLVPAHQGMKMRPGRWTCLGVVGATVPLWIPASARMTNSVAGDNYSRTNDTHETGPPKSEQLPFGLSVDKFDESYDTCRR